MKISVVGIGPGDEEYIIPVAKKVLMDADVVIGYKYYFQFITHLLKKDCECIGKELAEEEARAILAIEKCTEGKHVVVISSGDAGIYAMASLVYEKASKQKDKNIQLETVPGISAFVAVAARLGAPIGHDFCCISLSDLMTPWNIIEKRIVAAATGDFVTSLYNPRSDKRYWQLSRFKELFLEHRSGNTAVAIVRQVTRPEESVVLTTLEQLDVSVVDMFSLVLVGNSQTYVFRNYLVTPRGYLSRKPTTGEEIQQESFKQIKAAIKRKDLSPADKWAVIRCIHTTADFKFENIFFSKNDAIKRWSEFLKAGGEIVTDVTMVQAGITKEFIEKYATKIFCYLNDERTLKLAKEKALTRSQAAMQIAISRHPNALFVVGNAPTALIEICTQLHNNNFNPAGVIGAPVGFVNVLESKFQLATFDKVSMVIIKGKKGGSNVAASIVNACYTYGAELP